MDIYIYIYICIMHKKRRRHNATRHALNNTGNICWLHKPNPLTPKPLNLKRVTPGLHNKIPALKIFARGWVAQESICLHYQR